MEWLFGVCLDLVGAIVGEWEWEVRGEVSVGV